MQSNFDALPMQAGAFLTLMAENQLHSTFKTARQLNHLTKEEVFSELKAFVTYGSLTHEQKALLYKVIADNYMGGVVVPPGIFGEASPLTTIIPSDNATATILFVERTQQQEELNVYFCTKSSGIIQKVRFDKNLKPIFSPHHHRPDDISVEGLTALMVEGIKKFNPTFSGKSEGVENYCLNMEVSYSSESNNYKGVLKANDLGTLIARGKFFNSISDKTVVVESSKLSDMYKSIGAMLTEISILPKVFLQNVTAGDPFNKGELIVNIRIHHLVRGKLPEVIEEEFLRIKIG